MKKLLLLSICLAAALTLGAQTQQGYVKTIGKRDQKGQALSGVTVRVKGEHNAVVSKADGTFSMPMSGKKNGQPYTLQQVQKSGYELNERTVIGRQYAFSSTVPLTIVMVSSAQLQADKQRIENNAYKTAEKNYKAKMARLEKQLKEKSISEEQYRTDLQELQDKFEKYQSLIDELAEHYAHTDYDELDEKEVEVNILIENGELERADSLIHTLFDPVDVLKRNKEALARLDQTIAGAQGIIDQANADLAAVLRQQEKDAEYLYQLYTIALAQFDNEKASKYIQTRAELDTTNIPWQAEAGRFAMNYLADYSLTLQYYQRCLRQSQVQYGEQSDWAATFIDDIGVVFSQQENNAKALEWHYKAMALKTQLFGEEHPFTAMTYNNIASVYISRGNYAKALDWLLKVLNIQEKNLRKDDLSIATVCINIASAYEHNGNYPMALEYAQRALEIQEQQLEVDDRGMALTIHTMALIYDDMGNYDKALELYQKAFH